MQTGAADTLKHTWTQAMIQVDHASFGASIPSQSRLNSKLALSINAVIKNAGLGHKKM
jgi:hypothetical protein